MAFCENPCVVLHLNIVWNVSVSDEKDARDLYLSLEAVEALGFVITGSIDANKSGLFYCFFSDI